jgi:hypothetical protein
MKLLFRERDVSHLGRDDAREGEQRAMLNRLKITI